MRLHELRTREGEEEGRCLAHVADEVGDRVEQGVIGPVKVLEDDEQRCVGSQKLHEPPRRVVEVDRLVDGRVQPEAKQQA